VDAGAAFAAAAGLSAAGLPDSAGLEEDGEAAGAVGKVLLLRGVLDGHGSADRVAECCAEGSDDAEHG